MQHKCNRKLMGKKGKKYPAHQIARKKKFLMTRNHQAPPPPPPPPPPRRKLNGWPLSTRVSDNRKYVCGRRLYGCIIARKFKGLHSREITSLPEIKKNVMGTWGIISIIPENKPHAHHKTHLHSMKVCNTPDRSFAN